MIWRDVFVSCDMVESDGFTTEAGAVLTTALELFCRERRPAGSGDSPGPVALGGGAYEVVGEVRDVSPHGAWTLVSAGLTFYVTEAEYGPPEPGSRWRVRGELSIAEWYVVHEVGHGEPEARPFLVERIVRLQAGRSWDVPAVGRATPPGSHYRLTLAES